MEPAIRVESLGKRYKIGLREKAKQTFREALVGVATAPVRRLRALGERANDEETLWALRDVSFEVEVGAVVGIIGRNGAGKSTLLKVLSRITEPTEGRVALRGRVASLLEVGTGFHPELTGRENIYLNGAILGMKKAEIDRQFDAMVAFADLEKFLDTPVKRYSSGMSVRLAFAVAAHLEPEILLIDEVLAVGDAAFQKKCLGKMSQVASEGRTVLFVSHNMGAIQALCSRGILLHNGSIAADGASEQTVADYMLSLARTAGCALENSPERQGDGSLRVAEARILDESGRPAREVIAGNPVTLELYYRNHTGIAKASVLITLYNHLGVAATNFNMQLSEYGTAELGTEGTIRCRIPNLPLPVGGYVASIVMHRDRTVFDTVPNALAFDVVGSTFFSTGRSPMPANCTCMVAHEWEHVPDRHVHGAGVVAAHG